MNRQLTHGFGPLLGGIVFAVGLYMGGMLNPSKIIGFLDVTGNWDPSLLFVMMGAVGTHMVLYRLTMKKQSPLFDSNFYVPNRRDLDKRLIIGGVVFGAGWGIGGLCPGPGITAVMTAHPYAVTFLVAMAAGIYISRVFEPRASKQGK
jgi:uncharacterized membrane protein YedE/YeeE